MAKITNEWIRSLKLAKGKKESLYLLQIAGAVQESGIAEQDKIYRDTVDYIYENFAEPKGQSREFAGEVVKTCGQVLCGIAEYRIEEEELERFILAYRAL